MVVVVVMTHTDAHVHDINACTHPSTYLPACLPTGRGMICERENDGDGDEKRLARKRVTRGRSIKGWLPCMHTWTERMQDRMKG